MIRPKYRAKDPTEFRQNNPVQQCQYSAVAESANSLGSVPGDLQSYETKQVGRNLGSNIVSTKKNN